MLQTLPVALYIEGPKLQSEWDNAMASGKFTADDLLMRILASGLSFYLYNEVRA